jgi:hypothetical protein
MLNITLSTDTEVQLIATESAQFLSSAIYNAIRPIDWDNLSTEKKEIVIKEIRKNLETDTEVKRKKRETFVLDSLKEITLQLQIASKSEIIGILCPNLNYIYTRELQGKIMIRFNISPADGSNRDFNDLITTIKDMNISSKAFKQKENQDFDILADLLMLISVGARYTNNFTQKFDAIKFYSRDDKFKDNLDEFKKHLVSKNKKTMYEERIGDSVNKIFFVKPY